MNDELINIISKSLRQEFVIVIPTDTIIGLICLANSDKAIKKIYHLKKRNFNKPLSLLVSDIIMAKQYIEINKLSEKLINDPKYSFTIIGKQNNIANNLSSYINSKDQTLAMRVPKNKLLIDLITKFKLPLIATSANLAGMLPSQNFAEVKQLFTQQVEYFIDDIKKEKSAINHNPSAIINCLNNNKLTIIRADIEQKKYLYEKFANQRIFS